VKCGNLTDAKPSPAPPLSACPRAARRRGRGGASTPSTDKGRAGEGFNDGVARQKPFCLRGAQAGSVGAICDRPPVCALHANRRANTVRPYIERQRPAKRQRPAPRSVFSHFTFHISRFTFHVSHFTFHVSPFTFHGLILPSFPKTPFSVLSVLSVVKPQLMSRALRG
jgi:hypothetical protein